MPYGRCDESWFCFLIIYQVYKLINNLVTTFVCSVQAEGGRGLLSGGVMSEGAYVRSPRWHWPVEQTSQRLHSSQKRIFWIFTVAQTRLFTTYCILYLLGQTSNILCNKIEDQNNYIANMGSVRQWVKYIDRKMLSNDHARCCGKGFHVWNIPK